MRRLPYWWQCATRGCKWSGIRHANARVCPRCKGRTLKRFRRAKRHELERS